MKNINVKAAILTVGLPGMLGALAGWPIVAVAASLPEEQRAARAAGGVAGVIVGLGVAFVATRWVIKA